MYYHLQQLRQLKRVDWARKKRIGRYLRWHNQTQGISYPECEGCGHNWAVHKNSGRDLFGHLRLCWCTVKGCNCQYDCECWNCCPWT